MCKRKTKGTQPISIAMDITVVPVHHPFPLLQACLFHDNWLTSALETVESPFFKRNITEYKVFIGEK